MVDQEPAQVVCVAESVYSGALTRSKAYDVVTRDRQGQRVRIRDDRGRLRWFPLHCFVPAGSEPPARLVSFTLDQPIDDPATNWIEVSLTFSHGGRRWCVITTPMGLEASGDPLTTPDGRAFRLRYGLAHVLVVDPLEPAVIEAALDFVDRQGELRTCSLPLARSEEETR